MKNLILKCFYHLVIFLFITLLYDIVKQTNINDIEIYFFILCLFGFLIWFVSGISFIYYFSLIWRKLFLK